MPGAWPESVQQPSLGPVPTAVAGGTGCAEVPAVDGSGHGDTRGGADRFASASTLGLRPRRSVDPRRRCGGRDAARPGMSRTLGRTRRHDASNPTGTRPYRHGASSGHDGHCGVGEWSLGAGCPSGLASRRRLLGGSGRDSRPSLGTARDVPHASAAHVRPRRRSARCPTDVERRAPEMPRCAHRPRRRHRAIGATWRRRPRAAARRRSTVVRDVARAGMQHIKRGHPPRLADGAGERIQR